MANAKFYKQILIVIMFTGLFLHCATLDAYHFSLIADLPPVGYAQAIAHHDTNNDNVKELILSIEDPSQGDEWFGAFFYLINENLELNQVHVIPYFTPLVAGDVDQDGLQDLVGRMNGAVVVIESTTVDTYPTQVVWTSPDVSIYPMDPRVFDLDNDGNLEIVYHDDDEAFNAKLYI